MKVGLFIAFAGRNSGGPEVLERELTHAMLAAGAQHEYHLFCLDHRAPQSLGITDPNVVYHVLRPHVRPISMMTSLPRALMRVRPDVFHAPIVPPLICPMDFVMTMPCSTTLVHPEFYPPLIRLRLKALLHRGIPRAVKVVCVSRHVKTLVRERFRIDEDRLPLIYPGRTEKFRPQPVADVRASIAERFGLRRPYFLFSGRWEPRKNVVRTLEAFALFKRACRTDHKLVFTGRRTWAAGEADRAIERLQLARHIVDVGSTPALDLPALYAGARAVVFASLWEGFGLPIIEGMASGTPVITSDCAAMPEIAGGAALLVDPYSAESIADAMQRIVADDRLHATLREKGLARAADFTWTRTARETLAMYEEITGARPAAAKVMELQCGSTP